MNLTRIHVETPEDMDECCDLSLLEPQTPCPMPLIIQDVDCVQQTFCSPGIWVDWSHINNIPEDLGSNLFVINEEPNGSVNGSNATFTVDFNFIPESVDVKVNGLTQKRVDDFNTTGTQTVILVNSPTSGENILISYIKVT